MAVERYPDRHFAFGSELPDRWTKFVEVREDLLLDYGYDTARAYWSDLQHAYEWAAGHDKDILKLTQKDIRAYVALHRRRKYSETSIRRRVTALRLLYGLLVREGDRPDNPAEHVVIPKPRASTSSSQIVSTRQGGPDAFLHRSEDSGE